MEEREFANAAQPAAFGALVVTFWYSKSMPIALWNKIEVGETPSLHEETGEDEGLFGTHIHEAIDILGSWRRR